MTLLYDFFQNFKEIVRENGKPEIPAILIQDENRRK